MVLLEALVVEVVMAAVKQSGSALQHASQQLRGDCEFVLGGDVGRVFLSQPLGDLKGPLIEGVCALNGRRGHVPRRL